MNPPVRAVLVLAFGLWSGVMIGFAFLFAPLAFSTLGPTPVFAALIARTMGAITLFGYGCAAAAVLASLTDLRARPARAGALIVIALVMSALGWYEVHAIVPLMQQTALHTPAYDALHRRSSSIYAAVLILGLGATTWSAWTRA